MAGIQGNSVVIAMTEQVTPSSGVPANPVFDIVPRTGGDIDNVIGTTTSELVDTTRQGARPVLTSLDINGDIPTELQTTTAVFKNIVKGTLQNQIGADINYSAATISFDNATSKILDSGNGLTGLSVGSFFGVYDSTVEGNNQVYLVTSKANDGEATISPAPSDEIAGASITLKGSNVRSGKNEIGFTFQKRIPGSDGTVNYTFEDVQFASTAFSVTPQGIVTVEPSIIGLTKLDGVDQITGATDNPETTARVTGTVNGVPQIFLDSVGILPSEALATELSFTIDNQTTGVPVVGKAGAACLQHDAIAVTGTLNTILGDTVAEIQAEKLKAENQTEFQLAIVFKDPDNNYVVFDFPTVQYETLANPDTSNGVLLTNTGTFRAHGKNASAYTCGVTFVESP